MTTIIRPRSLRARLLLQILPAAALAVIALTAVAIKVASDSQRDAVYGQMSQLIAREAASFDGDARRVQAIAHDLGAAVESDTTRDRTRGAAVTNQFALSHPDLLGAWVAYEPNAYGRDAGYVSRGVTGDNEGRFAVWADRLKGDLHLAAFENPADNP
jgi:methyl-accepting chemotaxis protein